MKTGQTLNAVTSGTGKSIFWSESMSIQAMGQALEALRSFSPYDGRNLWIQEPEVDVDAAIMALVRAIEAALEKEKNS